MGEISLTDSPGASAIKKVTESGSYIRDGLALLKEINSLISNINNNPIVQRVFNKGAGETILTSPPGAKNLGSSPQLPPPSNTAGSTATDPGLDNKQIEAYFSTPEGIKKIIQAIDQFTPLIGENATLKDVKSLLSEAVGGKNVQTEKFKTPGEKEKSTKENKSISKRSKNTKK